MQTNLSKETFGEKIRKFFMMDSTKRSKRNIFNSLWAVFFGLVISSIMIGIFYQENPFHYFSSLFKVGFQKTQTSLAYIFVVYGIASIGVGFAFKSGLFNIGVSGQMTLAGLVTIIVFSKSINGGTDGGNDALGFGLLLLAMLVGFAYSALAGIMKAYFKIHEVVTTILLNWITVFIVQFFFGGQLDLTTIGVAANKDGRSAVFKITGIIFSKHDFWIFGLVVLFILASGTFVVLKFTSLGYKIKMNGINKNASSYAGVNQKLTTILVMGFSGALAGFAGFTFFFMHKQGMEGAKFAQPELIGFDTIAIALLGMNSSIGILFSSIFYAVLQNGAANLTSLSAYSTSEIIKGGDKVVVGLILYSAALSNSFSKFQPITWVIKTISRLTQKSYRDYYKNVYRPRINEIKREYKIAILRVKNLKKYNSDKYKEILNQLKQEEMLVLLIARQQSKLETKNNFNFDLAKFEQAKNNFEKAKLEIKNIQQKLTDLGYYEVKRLEREKTYNIDTANVEYIYKTTCKEFIAKINDVNKKIKIEAKNSETVAQLKSEKSQLYLDLKNDKENTINEFNTKIDKLILAAKENIFKNKTEIDNLVKELKQQNALLKSSMKQYANSFNKLSSREIELLFNELSKKKLEYKEQLDKLGYYQVEDVKLLSKAKIVQAKINNEKRVVTAVERFYFLTRYASGLVNTYITSSFINNLELKSKKLINDHKAKLEANQITEAEYNDFVNEIEQDKKDFYTLPSVIMIINNKDIKQSKTELVKINSLIKSKTKELENLDQSNKSLADEQKQINEEIQKLAIEKEKVNHELSLFKEKINQIYEQVKLERKELSQQFSNEIDPINLEKTRLLVEKMVKLEREG